MTHHATSNVGDKVDLFLVPGLKLSWTLLVLMLRMLWARSPVKVKTPVRSPSQREFIWNGHFHSLPDIECSRPGKESGLPAMRMNDRDLPSWHHQANTLRLIDVFIGNNLRRLLWKYEKLPMISRTRFGISEKPHINAHYLSSLWFTTKCQTMRLFCVTDLFISCRWPERTSIGCHIIVYLS